MKHVIFLLLTFLIGCGEEIPPIEPSEELRRTEQLSANGNLTASEVTTLKQVCNYLRLKDRYFKSNVINTNEQFNFETQYKDCSGSETVSGSISASIQQSGTQIKFYKVSGQGRYFADYEGLDQGMIAPYCDKLDDTTSTIARFMVKGDFVTLIYPLGFNPDYCPEVDNTLCVVVETGVSSDEDLATITERHTLSFANRKFETRQGMIISRILESSENCEETNSMFSSKLTNEN